MPYYMYIEKVLFPVTPGKISIKIENKNKTITLIDEGEVNLIKTPGLTDIQISELILPAIQKYPFANYLNDKFRNPEYYLNKLETWKKRKKPVQFKLSRTTPDGKNLLWDTNFDVTIEDYEIIEDAEKYGLDVCVKLNMKEYRVWGAKKLVIKKKKNSSKATATTKKVRSSKDTPKSYIVKKGDTLMKIAKKQLNDSSKWKSIYTLNKKTIQAEAKKREKPDNGHWIFPETKLKLPSGQVATGQMKEYGTAVGQLMDYGTEIGQGKQYS
ncbi:MAG: LysM peptidoglycan-binding domain-containing protein [Lachnospiraceae bacterium]|nr:LysM peptidoglycan-binding domain-containing protein [Lachnospiraceae bacterium]